MTDQDHVGAGLGEVDLARVAQAAGARIPPVLVGEDDRLLFAGKLRLRLGDEELLLGKGDGVTYGPQTVVEYSNAGRGVCEFVLFADSTQAGGMAAAGGA